MMRRSFTRKPAHAGPCEDTERRSRLKNYIQAATQSEGGREEGGSSVDREKREKEGVIEE